MSKFELKIESAPLFVVSISEGNDSESVAMPFSLDIDTKDITVFTVTIGEMGSGGGSGLPGATGPVGPAGPQGPSGSSSSGSGYEHVQASALTEWVVNHNLDRYPAVGVLTTGGIEILADVVHISTNQLRIYFNQPQAGRSIMR